ncbi:hypothetical protein BDY19DRAFT_887116 [Irpex rosettiformis]|uniref:Uncharacterized protein n=1 Tax=Irpex rosettiformis TaxID=378272 RepID=A0ACB8U925_9APHY|nr:hypothetical protein BDY19DRAFT_887116 [Irpex rosettiformis]
MGPSRTQKHAATSTVGEASSSKSHPHQKHHKKHGSKPKRPRSNEEVSGNTLPGVQKIKAALRQTKRLLAKEKLAADVRVVTERKQRALEADLAKAERARKERALAQKYHMIKFFGMFSFVIFFLERQKTVRRLKQVKNRLEGCTDKEEHKKLEKEIFNIRVDLNYINHYPKLNKYIALYPPEIRQQQGNNGKSKEPEDVDLPTAETDRQRVELQEQIRERMRNGELSMEPENDSEHRQQPPKASPPSKTTSEGTKGGAKHVSNIGEDAFFGEDSGDESDADEDEMDED